MFRIKIRLSSSINPPRSKKFSIEAEIKKGTIAILINCIFHNPLAMAKCNSVVLPGFYHFESSFMVTFSKILIRTMITDTKIAVNCSIPILLNE
jgi:hypothetical protein